MKWDPVRAFKKCKCPYGFKVKADEKVIFGAEVDPTLMA
jgi:hypothetical protein